MEELIPAIFLLRDFYVLLTPSLTVGNVFFSLGAMTDNRQA